MEQMKPHTGRPSDLASHADNAEPKQGSALAAEPDVAPINLVSREEMDARLTEMREEFAGITASLLETVNEKLSAHDDSVRELLTGHEKTVEAVLDETTRILASLSPEPQATGAAEPTAVTPEPQATGGGEPQ